MAKLYQSMDVCRITGLTSHQLREWCGRRAILRPDVEAEGRGRHALFSWQTMLSLRVLKDVHDSYGIEVGAWSKAIQQCRDMLRKSSFISLWGQSILFESAHEAAWASDGRHKAPRALMIALDPHLHAVRISDLDEPEMQLPLFKALGA